MATKKAATKRSSSKKVAKAPVAEKGVKAKKVTETSVEEKSSDAVLEVVDNATRKSKRARVVTAVFSRERVIAEGSDASRDLNNQSSFGSILDSGKLQLSLTEALYLMEKKRVLIFDGRNKQLDFDSFMRKAGRVEPSFWTRYAVFKDMRNRGYVVKTALKFGADFRVYDRGIKPGEDHARWIVYPVHEGEKYTWFDFAAKNRVAHSTKKRLMMGVVDDENDVTYWEIKWVRP